MTKDNFHETPVHETPGPKMPEYHSTDKTPVTRDEKVDAQMEDSFPASDPPSFSGGNHVVGAPVDRKSEPVTGSDPKVKAAEKQAEAPKA